ncbi:MAG TPA: phage repressor protein, partial [Pseudomonas sp.]|nr:phage repressor protein [Pseudomonas sp.]
ESYVWEGEWSQKPSGIQIEPGAFRRYLVSFDHNGEQQITPVPADACVMTHQQMIKAMLTPGDLPVSTDEMFEFAQAALTNLKMRSDCQTHQLRASRAAA